MTVAPVEYSGRMSSQLSCWKDHHTQINRSIRPNALRRNQITQHFPDLSRQYQSQDEIGITEKELSLITRKLYQHIFGRLGEPRPYPDLRNRTHTLLSSLNTSLKNLELTVLIGTVLQRITLLAQSLSLFSQSHSCSSDPPHLICPSNQP